VVASAGRTPVTDKALWLLETDFGNQLTLNEDEIRGLYLLGFEQDYDTWWDARLERIRQSVSTAVPSHKLRRFLERFDQS
jgi:hypothetical protein